jgi:hypothetical protein
MYSKCIRCEIKCDCFQQQMNFFNFEVLICGFCKLTTVQTNLKNEKTQNAIESYAVLRQSYRSFQKTKESLIPL